jgi:regulator of protease activity HflC (stomatin/prohibitin superfamily)
MMGAGEVVLLVVAAAAALFIVVTLLRSVRVVPQQRMDVVERLGKYQRTLRPGLNLLMPFVDAVRSKVDMREQVVSFPPQPVITSDNLVVSIDTVLYFKVVDPVRATYEIANFLQGIEQLVVTTLRNVIGSLDLERALTSREEINRHLSGVLDETTGRWGIKVTRVELKAIEPPPSIRDSMEKQMRAERDRRAAILNAEGVKQSQILTAEGEKQAAVLRAEGDRTARILQAEGQAKAIHTVFEAVHNANPDPKVLAYQYLQALPQIAAGPGNKMWIVPVELTRALEGIGGALGGLSQAGSVVGAGGPAESYRVGDEDRAEGAGGPGAIGGGRAGDATDGAARGDAVLGDASLGGAAADVAAAAATVAAIEAEAAGHIAEAGAATAAGIPAPAGRADGDSGRQAIAAAQPDPADALLAEVRGRRQEPERA